MSKNIELDDAIFRLEMLTETFIALEEATEHSENELPKHFLYFPVAELKNICCKMIDIISNQ